MRHNRFNPIINRPSSVQWILVNGRAHCSNGPAVYWPSGVTDWWLFGNWHRYYGPRRSKYIDEWWIHGKMIK